MKLAKEQVDETLTQEVSKLQNDVNAQRSKVNDLEGRLIA
jgi:hypothetical protein